MSMENYQQLSKQEQCEPVKQALKTMKQLK